MFILGRLHDWEKYFRVFIKWSLSGLLMGLIGGAVGAFFAHTLRFVTQLREANPWLIYLLPLGGIVTAGLYQLFKMSNNRGTNELIVAVLNNQSVRAMVAPIMFACTTVTHLLGGSAGREGAALQIGGSFASMLAKLLRFKERDRTILIMSGMSAVFAGLFGTPLTATLFALEFESVGTIFSPALLPCYLSAFTASRLSAAFGVHSETAIFTETVPFTAITNFKILILSLAVALLSIAVCTLMHKMEYLAKKYIPNVWLRIVLGAIVIIGLTLLVGDQRYNGAGMEMALGAIAGNAEWYDFLLKFLFTAVTLAVGFKGGEIVPTFCIGATFGCVLGNLLGMDPCFAAALGLIGLFCCVTNSPITAIVLSVEMFGSANIHLFAFVSVIVFVLSGNCGLYSSQKFPYLKE